YLFIYLLFFFLNSIRGKELYNFIINLFDTQFLMHFNWGNGYQMYLYDLTTIGYLIYPTLFQFERIHLFIHKDTGFSYYDSIIIDPNYQNIVNYILPNSWLCTNIDIEKFINAFIRDVSNLIKSS